MGYKGHLAPTPYLGGAAVIAGFTAVLLLLSRGLAAQRAAARAASSCCGRSGRSTTAAPSRPPCASSSRSRWRRACGRSASAGTSAGRRSSTSWSRASGSSRWSTPSTSSTTWTARRARWRPSSRPGSRCSALVQGDGWLTVAAAALCGACLGFLPHNLLASPARIFLGDGGSMPIGFAIGALVMIGTAESAAAWQSLAMGVLLVGVPALDTALVIVSRLRQRIPILTGGRDHMTHRTLAPRAHGAGGRARAGRRRRRWSRRSRCWRSAPARPRSLLAVALYVAAACVAIVVFDTRLAPARRRPAEVVGASSARGARRSPGGAAARALLAGDRRGRRASARSSSPTTRRAAGRPAASPCSRSRPAVAVARAGAPVGAAGAGARRARRPGALCARRPTAGARRSSRRSSAGNRYARARGAARPAGAARAHARRRARPARGGHASPAARPRSWCSARLLAGDEDAVPRRPPERAARLHQRRGGVLPAAGVAVPRRRRAAPLARCSPARRPGRRDRARAASSCSRSRAGRRSRRSRPLAVVVALVPGRLHRLLLLAVLGRVPGAGSSRCCSTSSRRAPAGPTATPRCERAALVLLLGAAVAGRRGRGDRRRSPALARVLRPVAVAGLAVAVLVLGGIARPPGRSSRTRSQRAGRTSFRSPGIGRPLGPARRGSRPARATATTTGGSPGARGATTRCCGIGAGGYDVPYFRQRATEEDIRQPHSLQLQVLSELGLARGRAAAGASSARSAGARRAPCAPPGARPTRSCSPSAGIGAFVAWLVQTSVDWLHLLPGVTAVALARGGAAARGRPGRRPRDGAAMPGPRAAAAGRGRSPWRSSPPASASAARLLAEHYRDRARAALAADPAARCARRTARCGSCPTRSAATTSRPPRSRASGRADAARAVLARGAAPQAARTGSPGRCSATSRRGAASGARAARAYGRAVALNPRDRGLRELRDRGPAAEPSAILDPGEGTPHGRCLALSVTAALAGPAPAPAQDDEVYINPDSPSGVEYDLPAGARPPRRRPGNAQEGAAVARESRSAAPFGAGVGSESSGRERPALSRATARHKRDRRSRGRRDAALPPEVVAAAARPVRPGRLERLDAALRRARRARRGRGRAGRAAAPPPARRGLISRPLERVERRLAAAVLRDQPERRRELAPCADGGDVARASASSSWRSGGGGA